MDGPAGFAQASGAFQSRRVMPGAHAGCVHSFAVMRPAAAELGTRRARRTALLGTVLVGCVMAGCCRCRLRGRGAHCIGCLVVHLVSLLNNRLCSFLFATVNLLWLGILHFRQVIGSPPTACHRAAQAAASYRVHQGCCCRHATGHSTAGHPCLAVLTHLRAPVAPGQCSDCLSRHVAPLLQFSLLVHVWLLAPHTIAAAGFCCQAWHPATSRQ